tara:strand:- start:728 stop:922 length:195 start_codon:yes stop_codon:yes gene_type:complete
MTEDERAQMFLDETLEQAGLPPAKIKPSFGGCYNYKKLKKEGLVDEKSESSDETDAYDKIPSRY